MPRAVKIAISLPEPLLLAADAECRRTGKSRSELFRDAVAEALREERERSDDQAYVRAYQEHPETDAEIALAQRLGRGALEREPWG